MYAWRFELLIRAVAVDRQEKLVFAVLSSLIRARIRVLVLFMLMRMPKRFVNNMSQAGDTVDSKNPYIEK